MSNKKRMIFAILIIFFTVAIYVYCEIILKLSSTFTYTLVMIVNIPLTIIGFIPIKGQYFEEYFKSVLNGIRSPKKLGKFSTPPNEVLELIKKSQMKGR